HLVDEARYHGRMTVPIGTERNDHVAFDQRQGFQIGKTDSRALLDVDGIAVVAHPFDRTVSRTAVYHQQLIDVFLRNAREDLLHSVNFVQRQGQQGHLHFQPLRPQALPCNARPILIRRAKVSQSRAEIACETGKSGRDRASAAQRRADLRPSLPTAVRVQNSFGASSNEWGHCSGSSRTYRRAVCRLAWSTPDGTVAAVTGYFSSPPPQSLLASGRTLASSSCASTRMKARATSIFPAGFTVRGHAVIVHVTGVRSFDNQLKATPSN